MTLDIDTMLRVLEACDAEQADQRLVSLVFPRRGGGSGQVFLAWKQGRCLKDYIREPALAGTLTLYQAAHSRIVDHRNIRRRLTYVPIPGDELRFIRATPVGDM